MNRYDSESLDRHLTGDWGEDSVPDNDDDPVADAVDRERWTDVRSVSQLVVTVKAHGWTAASDAAACYLAGVSGAPLAVVRDQVESIAWRTP